MTTCKACHDPLTPGRLPDDAGMCAPCYSTLLEVWAQSPGTVTAAELKHLVLVKRGRA